MLRVTFIDEVGYLTYGPDAANVLFHVVNERHLRRRLIFLDGPSGRTRHLNLDETLPTKSERVRISGINGSECLDIGSTDTKSTRRGKR